MSCIEADGQRVTKRKLGSSNSQQSAKLIHKLFVHGGNARNARKERWIRRTLDAQAYNIDVDE